MIQGQKKGIQGQKKEVRSKKSDPRSKKRLAHDLSTNPVQVFTATDLAHLASHLALTTHVLSQQAQNMEELSEIDD